MSKQAQGGGRGGWSGCPGVVVRTGPGLGSLSGLPPLSAFQLVFPARLSIQKPTSPPLPRPYKPPWEWDLTHFSALGGPTGVATYQGPAAQSTRSLPDWERIEGCLVRGRESWGDPAEARV